MSLHIRPATEDDLPALVRLDKEVFPDIAYGLVPIRQFLDLCGEHFLVLDDGSSLCGYAFAARRSPDPTESWFLALGLAEKVRGQGLGTRLTRELFDRLRAGGVHRVRTTVAPTNLASLALCTSMGFAPDGPEHGLRKDYFGPGEDRLVLWLRL